MFAVGRPENKAVGIEETTKCGTAVSQVPVSLHLTKRKSQISNDGDIESIPYMGSAVSSPYQTHIELWWLDVQDRVVRIVTVVHDF